MNSIEHPKYGTGKAGENAKQIIESKTQCVECMSTADMTLDFDVLGTLEQLPVCKNCFEIVKQKVARDLVKSGRDPTNTFGINGCGRS